MERRRESVVACGNSDSSCDSSQLPVIAVETVAGAQTLSSFQFPEQCILMVGAEDSGVCREAIEGLELSVSDQHAGRSADAVVYIPLPGVHHSLNVATALAIALYEYRRQWPGEDTTRKT